MFSFVKKAQLPLKMVTLGGFLALGGFTSSTIAENTKALNEFADDFVSKMWSPEKNPMEVPQNAMCVPWGIRFCLQELYNLADPWDEQWQTIGRILLKNKVLEQPLSKFEHLITFFNTHLIKLNSDAVQKSLKIDFKQRLGLMVSVKDSTGAEKVLNILNTLVSNRTDGAIHNLLSKNQINSETAFCLVHTLHTLKCLGIPRLMKKKQGKGIFIHEGRKTRLVASLRKSLKCSIWRTVYPLSITKMKVGEMNAVWQHFFWPRVLNFI